MVSSLSLLQISHSNVLSCHNAGTRNLKWPGGPSCVCNAVKPRSYGSLPQDYQASPPIQSVVYRIGKQRWQMAEDWQRCAIGMLPSMHDPTGNLPCLDLPSCGQPSATKAEGHTATLSTARPVLAGSAEEAVSYMCPQPQHNYPPTLLLQEVWWLVLPVSSSLHLYHRTYTTFAAYIV